MPARALVASVKKGSSRLKTLTECQPRSRIELTRYAAVILLVTASPVRNKSRVLMFAQSKPVTISTREPTPFSYLYSWIFSPLVPVPLLTTTSFA